MAAREPEVVSAELRQAMSESIDQTWAWACDSTLSSAIDALRAVAASGLVGSYADAADCLETLRLEAAFRDAPAKAAS